MRKIITKIRNKLMGASRQDSEAEQVCVNNAPHTEEYEYCVLCGALTSIPVSMPIDWRENYEIGFGQICAECAKKQSRAPGKEKELTTSQVILAVEQSRKENNQQ